jgi:hypothetical protein
MCRLSSSLPAYTLVPGMCSDRAGYHTIATLAECQTAKLAVVPNYAPYDWRNAATTTTTTSDVDPQCQGQSCADFVTVSGSIPISSTPRAF